MLILYSVIIFDISLLMVRIAWLLSLHCLSRMKREGERGKGKEGEGDMGRERERLPNVYTYPKLLILVKDTVLEICSISCCVCQNIGT